MILNLVRIGILEWNRIKEGRGDPAPTVIWEMVLFKWRILPNFLMLLLLPQLEFPVFL